MTAQMILKTFAVSAALLLAAPVSHAGTGVVRGRILFYQNQGNFCPTTRNCTGATYLQSQFNVNNPIGETKVYLRDGATNAIIGQGATDASGNFTVAWFTLFTTPSSANFIWVGEHKDNRYAIRTSTGGQWVFWIPNFALTNGTTASAPQDIGGWVWGSAGAPNALANVYDGAFRTWNYAFRFSNRMNVFFTGLEVRAFLSDCPTSCALGPENRILLDPNSAYAPQARIMHEMGHIASYKASRDQNFRYGGDYCFPSTGTGCGWFLNGPEWGAASFEEGLATFYGDVALYWWNATQPHTCLTSAAACATNAFNIETSSGTPASCATNENRWPLTADRYLWDAYDAQVDYAADTLQRSYFEFFDTVHAFDNGTGNNQKDEPWCCFIFCWICDTDGRSPVDFRTNWNTWGTNSFDPWNNNCQPAGD